MAAAAATGHTARRVAPPAECPCSLADGVLATEIVFDDTPARAVAEEGDRELVKNVSHIMQSIHAGVTNPVSWHVEFDEASDGLITVMVKYPKGTCITVNQMNAIKLVNDYRVRDVWSQPEDECVFLGASVSRSDVALPLTVEDIVLLRRRVDITSDPSKPVKKRMRASRR